MLFSLRYNDDITYWGNPVIDTYGSETFDAPVTFKGRWEDRNDVFKTDTGEDLMSKSVIFTTLDLDMGGYLYQGTSVALDPHSVEGAAEIQKIIKVPDLRNLTTEKRAIL